jgi:hypothetical protein
LYSEDTKAQWFVLGKKLRSLYGPLGSRNIYLELSLYLHTSVQFNSIEKILSMGESITLKKKKKKGVCVYVGAGPFLNLK